MQLGLPCESWASQYSQAAPSIEELKNTTYIGFEEPAGPVKLVNGQWEGRPYVEGGASRPSVTFFGELAITGDLDDDGTDEALVFINVNTGGTGQLLHMAVVARRARYLENIATTFVGDRIQIQDAKIQNSRIILKVVQAGSQNAACCPGDIATRSWTLDPNGVLKSEHATKNTERLTLETIGDTQWVLRSWQWDEQALATPEVTLGYREGRFTGNSGCNNYFVPVKMGAMPGEVAVGIGGSTRKACPDAAMVVENRFIYCLAGVKKFGFMATWLALFYEKDRKSGVMLFDKKRP